MLCKTHLGPEQLGCGLSSLGSCILGSFLRKKEVVDRRHELEQTQLAPVSELHKNKPKIIIHQVKISGVGYMILHLIRHERSYYETIHFIIKIHMNCHSQPIFHQ